MASLTFIHRFGITHLLGCATLACAIASSQAAANTPVIDGVLDEPQWQQAKLISNFSTVEPFSLAQPEHRTVAKMWESEQGIYIGIVNTQPFVTQRATRIARDGEISSDRNQIIIDFDNNKLAAYGFEVGNGGSMRDGIWSDENEFSADWDGNWQAATSSSETQWVSEVFIPWDIAPMSKVDTESREVSLYIARNVVHLGKKFASAPADNDQARFLSEFPSVEITNHSSRSFKAFASVTGSQDLLNGHNSLDPSLDVFWQPDSAKQISLTVNPDFGQVESDNLVVNFSPDETFFNEKRPFFTENQSLFSVEGPQDLRVVHTRRIGGPNDIGSGAGDIQAAAKFTSNGNVWSYGAFAVTEGSDDEVQGRDFAVARVERKTEKLRLGVLATFADRPDLQRTATSQTLDYDYTLNERNTLRGQFIHASVDQTVSDIETGDATDVQQSDMGAWIRLDQQVNSEWFQQIEYSRYGDEFEINDLGFLPRNNSQRYRYKVDIKRPVSDPDSRVNEHKWFFRYDHLNTMDGEKLLNVMHLEKGLEFKNTQSIYVWGRYYPSGGMDDRITRGNNKVNVDDGYFVGYHFNGVERKKLRYHHMMEWVDRPLHGKGIHLHIHPTYNFNDNVSAVWGWHYNVRKNWVLWQEDNNLNAFTKNQLENYIDLNAHLSDKQDLRVKFQWISLSAKGEQALTADTNGELQTRAEPVESFALSDTALQIRYTYKLGPLSNIYVVYSRGGRELYETDANPYGLFSDGWRNRTGDNFLVKIRYLL